MDSCSKRILFVTLIANQRSQARAKRRVKRVNAEHSKHKNIMFHIDTTFEDTRIVAHSEDGKVYDVSVYDNLTGDNRTLLLNAEQLHCVMAMHLHPDGVIPTTTTDEAYAMLEPMIVGWPVSLRPIP